MSRKRKDIQTAIAVCSIEVKQASTEVQLTPAGQFRSVDGRPTNAPFWFIDAAIAARFTKFEWREGVGLFAIDVEWTDRATEFIESKECGFISPVLPYKKGSGEVLGFLHAALTNTPAVDGMDEVAALAAKHLNISQEDIMDREQLIAMLNLSANASDEDITSAIAVLKQNKKASDEQGEEITALRQTQFNPEKHIDLEAFEETKNELVALKQANLETEVAALVATGFEDGRLMPAQEAWAKSLGASDTAALKQYLDDATGIAALKGQQTGGKKPEDQGDSELSESDIAVCKSTGVSHEDFKKNKEG